MPPQAESRPCCEIKIPLSCCRAWEMANAMCAGLGGAPAEGIQGGPPGTNSDSPGQAEGDSAPDAEAIM